MNRQLCDELIASLLRYRAHAKAEQRTQTDRIIDFIRSCDAPWRRSMLQGHLTASAWIVDAASENALLVHHKKLDKWLQPGGHIDDEDASFLDAALREAREETGLASVVPLWKDAPTALFDVDVHAIPERGAEPVHYHYDLRFCFVADRSDDVVASANESNDAQWFSLPAISSDMRFDSSVRRLARIAPNACV
jgi:8-oxo-dGTP pyrophosphatase MutT (NUDIX family)